jgi:hypothetical protein
MQQLYRLDRGAGPALNKKGSMTTKHFPSALYSETLYTTDGSQEQESYVSTIIH